MNQDEIYIKFNHLFDSEIGNYKSCAFLIYLEVWLVKILN